MIEERHARFEADGHRRTIDLREDVGRQVGERIDRHRLLGEAQMLGPRGHRVERRRRLVPRQREPFRMMHRRHQQPVQPDAALCRHHVAELVQAVADTRRRFARLHAAPRPLRDGRELVGVIGPQRMQRGGDPCTHRRRHAMQLAPQARRQEVARIAAEQLVAAVAGQAHLHVPARQLRHEEGRNLRGVGERLVIDRRQLRHDAERMVGRHVEFGMARAEMTRDRLRVTGFVVACFMEADRKRVDRRRRLRLHQRDDRRRIDAARQKGAERHVRFHLPRNGLAQDRVELADRFVGAALERLRAAILDGLLERPVRAQARRITRMLELDEGARRQLVNAAIDRVRRGHARLAQVQAQRVAIDSAVEARIAAQRLEFGCEYQRVADPAVIERLLADPVARERQHPRRAVPQREREHAGRAPQRRLDTPCDDRRDQHLAVGVAAPRRCAPCTLEFRAQFAMVVDFAVEDDDVATARGCHRLSAVHRQVDDREPPVAERDAGLRIDPDPLPVRPAMREACRHPREGAARCLLIEGDAIQKAVDSAHLICPPLLTIFVTRGATSRPAAQRDGRAILRRNKSAIIHR